MQLSSTQPLEFPIAFDFLENNASSEYKMCPQTQQKFANKNAEFIIDICRRFHFDYNIPTTALKLSNKFFNVCSYYQFDRLIVLVACLSLAAKINDKIIKLYEIACVFYRLVVRNPDIDALKKVMKGYEDEVERLKKQEKQRQQGELNSRLKVIVKKENGAEQKPRMTPEEEQKLKAMKAIIEEIGDQIMIAESSVLKTLCFQINQKGPTQFFDQYLIHFYPNATDQILKRIEFCTRIIIMDSQRIQASLKCTPLTIFISALMIASEYQNQKPYAYLKRQKIENANKSDYQLYSQWLQYISEVEGEKLTRNSIIECIGMLNWLLFSS